MLIFLQEQFAKFLEANPDSKSKKTPILTKEEESLVDKYIIFKYNYLSKCKNDVSVYRRDGKPEKAPASGYALYCSEMQSKLPDGTAKKSMPELNTLWKTLSAEKKSEYQDRVLLVSFLLFSINKVPFKFFIYISDEDRLPGKVCLLRQVFTCGEGGKGVDE